MFRGGDWKFRFKKWKFILYSREPFFWPKIIFTSVNDRWRRGKLHEERIDPEITKRFGLLCHPSFVLSVKCYSFLDSWLFFVHSFGLFVDSRSSFDLSCWCFWNIQKMFPKNNEIDAATTELTPIWILFFVIFTPPDPRFINLSFFPNSLKNGIKLMMKNRKFQRITN